MFNSPDNIDNASMLALAANENAVKAFLGNCKKQARPKSAFCVECGDPIPLGRQIATGGTDICVSCLQDLERR